MLFDAAAAAAASAARGFGDEVFLLLLCLLLVRMCFYIYLSRSLASALLAKLRTNTAFCACVIRVGGIG